ncbi:EamA family transporter [Gammaproteobacteria bacterium]|nr:EamA family transporter [Gammaproteobacteria bacterium]
MELKNWILLILLGAVWGSAFMFIKISADDFGPILLVNLRLLLAGLLFIPFLLQKKYLAHFKSHVSGILILLNYLITQSQRLDLEYLENQQD